MSTWSDESEDEEREWVRLPQPAMRVLEDVIEPGWAIDAACAQVDPELWFPEKGGTTRRAVLEICAECPVRESCLAAALVGVDVGIWGGVRDQARSEARGQIARGADPLAVLDELLDQAAAIQSGRRSAA